MNIGRWVGPISILSVSIIGIYMLISLGAITYMVIFMVFSTFLTVLVIEEELHAR